MAISTRSPVERLLTGAVTTKVNPLMLGFFAEKEKKRRGRGRGEGGDRTKESV